MKDALRGVRKLALIGSYTPRQCGIATFTTDLLQALSGARPDIEVAAIAMNDPGKTYEYPEEVVFQIAQDDLEDYVKCARFLEASGTELLCVQHEFGIFGGPAGAHLLELLEEVRIPVVATLHTILERPNAEQSAVMDRLARRATTLVVMSAKGKQLLQEVYGVPSSKVRHIHHGVPLPNPEAGNLLKIKHGLAGKTVLLTFGLLSPDKGIQHVIEALPSVVSEGVDVAYAVVGATHPHIRAHSGEAYRESLRDRAAALGVGDRVLFHNEFVTQSDLTGFLALSDLYVTPYLKEEQITSGTLAYAVGCGKAVVSTPYWYAAELLAEQRGVLVPWRDPDAIARAVIDLATDRAHRSAIESRALALGQSMRWPRVARQYWEAFDQVQSASALQTGRAVPSAALASREQAPRIDLRHVRAMTDDTGMLQHARHNVPNYAEGYCLDDNARALLLATLARQALPGEGPLLDALESRYLAFLFHAFRPEDGRFRNFMAYDRTWLELYGSEDSHGRALWALGTASRRLSDSGRSSLASQLFHNGLSATLSFTSPRAWAYTLLGIDEALRAAPSEPILEQIGEELATRLLAAWTTYANSDWNWFEPHLSYCNARLPEALMISGQWLEREDMVDASLQSLEWLAELQTNVVGMFEPIGSDRVMLMGEPKPLFDQQPVEAYCTISACARAWRATRDSIWKRRASDAYRWYFGRNALGLALADPTNGGCFDGLCRHGVNRNQGAESTLSLHLATLEMMAAGFIEPQRSPDLVHIR